MWGVFAAFVAMQHWFAASAFAANLIVVVLIRDCVGLVGK